MQPGKGLQVLLWASAGVRLLLVLWGEIQDAWLAVKYTDIDYVVFTDAARFVAHGQSPFERSTYRYSPLLAYLLLPNVWLHGSWGKLLFSAGDIAAAALIVSILCQKGASPRGTLLAATAWLCNPYTFTISTRGSCDVLAAILLLGLLRLLASGHKAWAALVYGLVVHLRIYPIVFAPALVLHLAKERLSQTGAAAVLVPTVQQQDETTRRRDSPTQSHEAGNAGKGRRHASLWSYPCSLWLRQVLLQGSVFGAMSAATFLLLGAAFFQLYGHPFLHEAFLHHLTRKDPRHNFSPHFYPTYLTAYSADAWRDTAPQAQPDTAFHEAVSWACGSTPTTDEPTLCSTLASSTDGSTGYSSSHPFDVSSVAGWLPDVGKWSSVVQLLLQLVLAAALHGDLPTCLLIQTMAFVALNKVCTAQYFMWFFCLLPLLLPAISWPPPRGLVLATCAWTVAQLHWLLWGYLLEFQGLAVQLPLWFASLIFLAANTFLICQVISSIRKPLTSKVKRE